MQGSFDAGYLYECKFTSEEEKKKVEFDEDPNEPTRHVPLRDSGDIPMTFLRTRLVLCYAEY